MRIQIVTHHYNFFCLRIDVVGYVLHLSGPVYLRTMLQSRNIAEPGEGLGKQEDTACSVSDVFAVLNINSSLKFEIKAKQFYAASQRVL